jgi:hypothetical protein
MKKPLKNYFFKVYFSLPYVQYHLSVNMQFVTFFVFAIVRPLMVISRPVFHGESRGLNILRTAKIPLLYAPWATYPGPPTLCPVGKLLASWVGCLHGEFSISLGFQLEMSDYEAILLRN